MAQVENSVGKHWSNLKEEEKQICSRDFPRQKHEDLHEPCVNGKLSATVTSGRASTHASKELTLFQVPDSPSIVSTMPHPT
jgi:hypothetical protein